MWTVTVSFWTPSSSFIIISGDCFGLVAMRYLFLLRVGVDGIGGMAQRQIDRRGGNARKFWGCTGSRRPSATHRGRRPAAGDGGRRRVEEQGLRQGLWRQGCAP